MAKAGPGRCLTWAWQEHLPHPLAKPSLGTEEPFVHPSPTEGGGRGYFLLTSPQICNPAVKLCQSQLIRQRFPLPSPAWLLPPHHVASANVQPRAGETTLLQELRSELPQPPAPVPPCLGMLNWGLLSSADSWGVTRIQDLCPSARRGRSHTAERREHWGRTRLGCPQGDVPVLGSSEPELKASTAKLGTWWQNHTTASLEFTFSCNPERKGTTSQEKWRVHISLRGCKNNTQLTETWTSLGLSSPFSSLKYIPSNTFSWNTHRAQCPPAQAQHANHSSTFTAAVPETAPGDTDPQGKP